MNETSGLYQERLGAGPPLMLLHGFTGSTATMRGLAENLASDATSILVDLIGHGRSPAPRRSAYSMTEAVRGVGDVLRSVDEPSALLGYSMGARVALAVAAVTPGLRGLVLIGARAGIADPEQRKARRVSDELLADAIQQNGMEWFVDMWSTQPFFATQRELGPGHLAQARAQRLANLPRALAASLRGMGVGSQEPLHDVLPRIDVPTLVMVGERDRPFIAEAEALAKGLPHAELSMVPGVGHATHVEAPAATADRIRPFLARI